MTFSNCVSESARRLLMFALMASLLLTAGCKGCFDDSEASKKPEEKEKAKRNFEFQTPVTLPGRYPLDPEERMKLEEEAKDDDAKKALLNRLDPAFRNKTKLGHWVSVDFLAIANNFNADGYLETTAYTRGLPQLIEGTDYSVQTSRPVNLVKGDWKKLESSVYLPRKEKAATSAPISYVINNGSSIPAINIVQPHNVLEDYQFHMVLLSNRSDSLNYLNFLDCIKLPGGSASLGEEPTFYSLIPSVKGNPIPLPSQALNWTTIAYLIWDDLDPDDLSRAQQQALVDWLQFGGQIILSGPDCIDRLQSSFMADYLPGQFEESITLDKAALEELNSNWAVTSFKNKAEKRELVVPEASPLAAIRFKPHVDATFIEGSSGLALERRIGRGRVVATAFSINNPQIKKDTWRSFSSFFHNALLRKPDRFFTETPDLNLITFKYQNDSTSIYDPLTGSTLRYISRDLAANKQLSKNTHTEAVLPIDYSGASLADQALLDGMGAMGSRSDYILAGTGLSRNKDDYLHYGGFQSYRQSGVAGWNDDSGVASAARETLKKAARITPPSASFVMKMLGLYLLVLVPLNWLIFRLMGKVEWAWIAAPIIALTGAFMVVKYAALDIGFVRSVTHVGLLELQGDFERGHMTDYSALYTSLSTRYNVEMDNLSGQSLPFANVAPDSFKKGEIRKQVELERTTTTDLRNFLVRSNSTGLLHTEMMIDAGGAISLKGDESLYEVENESLINLEDVGVVRRTDDGELQFAWLGDLEAGADSQLDFKPVENSAMGWNKAETLVGNSKAADTIWNSLEFEPNQNVALAELAEAPELQEDWKQLSQILEDKQQSLSSGVVSRSMLASALSEIGGSNVSLVGVFNCVVSNLKVGPGEFRLIGHASQKIGQTKYNPDATQASHNLLVVVHLRQAALPKCQRDHNAVSDFLRGKSNLDREDEDSEFFTDDE